MIDYRVCIATLGRSKVIVKKTIALLQRHKIEMDRVDILLGTPQEADAYRETLNGIWDGDFIFHYQTDMMSIVNFIRMYYKYETSVKYLVRMDDDLDEIINMDRKPCKDLNRMICKNFEFTENLGLRYWGIGAVPNPFFMKDKMAVGLRFIHGAFNCEIIDREREDIQTEFSQYEDTSMTCEFYLRDGGVVKDCSVALKTKLFTDGGMNQNEGGYDERIKNCNKLAYEMKEHYGDMVSVVDKGFRKDIKINWRYK